MTKLQTYWTSLTPIKKQALADKVGVNKGTLSNIFNNQKTPSLKLAKKILAATNHKVKFSWFLCE